MVACELRREPPGSFLGIGEDVSPPLHTAARGSPDRRENTTIMKHTASSLDAHVSAAASAVGYTAAEIKAGLEFFARKERRTNPPGGKNRMTSIFLSHMIWWAGGTYFDSELNVNFDNTGTVAALEYLRDMAQFSLDGINSYSYGDMINVYLTGRIGQDIWTPRIPPLEILCGV
jgi:hypothetical protein